MSHMTHYLSVVDGLLRHAGYTTEVHDTAVTVYDPVFRKFAGEMVFDHYNKVRIVDLDQLLRFLDARGK